MATNIKLKRSSVVGKQPQVSDLDYGELALNYADGVLYFKNASNSIAQISGGGGAETDSVAPSASDGDLWWDAVNGKLKVYYNDGTPSNSPITVSATVNSTYTNNSGYGFNAYSSRDPSEGQSVGTPLNPSFTLQAGDTLTITNGEFANHPMYFVTALGLGNSYDSQYNVQLPASGYGGGTSSVSYQFNSPGTYYYICSVHSGMYGTINVAAVDTYSSQWVDAAPSGRGYTGSAGAVSYSETAPSSPSNGQIWFNTQNGKSYIRYDNAGNAHWILFSDPTVTDGDRGYTGSVGYVGSRGTISPRSWSFYDPANLSFAEQTLFFTDTALEVSDIKGVLVGGTDVTYTVRHGTNRSDTGTVVATSTASSTSTGTTATISAASIPANSWLWIEIGTVNGIVDEFSVNIIFSE